MSGERRSDDPTGHEPTNTGGDEHLACVERVTWLIETALLALEILNSEEALQQVEKHCAQVIAECQIDRATLRKRQRSGKEVHGEAASETQKVTKPRYSRGVFTSDPAEEARISRALSTNTPEATSARAAEGLLKGHMGAVCFYCGTTHVGVDVLSGKECSFCASRTTE